MSEEFQLISKNKLLLLKEENYYKYEFNKLKMKLIDQSKRWITLNLKMLNLIIKDFFFKIEESFFQEISNRHLGKLIKNQAILDDDNVEYSQLQEIIESVKDMNQQNLELMKNFQTINQVPDDQPLPQDFILMSERMARNYDVPTSDDELNQNFDKLNNYFQNEIKTYYKKPLECPYLKFIPKIV